MLVREQAKYAVDVAGADVINMSLGIKHEGGAQIRATTKAPVAHKGELPGHGVRPAPQAQVADLAVERGGQVVGRLAARR